MNIARINLFRMSERFAHRQIVNVILNHCNPIFLHFGLIPLAVDDYVFFKNSLPPFYNLLK